MLLTLRNTNHCVENEYVENGRFELRELLEHSGEHFASIAEGGFEGGGHEARTVHHQILLLGQWGTAARGTQAEARRKGKSLIFILYLRFIF